VGQEFSLILRLFNITLNNITEYINILIKTISGGEVTVAGFLLADDLTVLFTSNGL
jgi:hypothetical protein